MDQDKDKVVNLGDFRKKKEETPTLTKNWLTAVSDRYGFNLRADGKFEIIEGGKVIEARDPTYPERQMAVHMLYLEAMVQKLISKHEPHRKNDDYLTYPYTDWETECKRMGKAAEEWNARFVDEPTAPLQRATHLLIEAVRVVVEAKQCPGKVGLMSQEQDVSYRDITSDRSYFYFRVEDAEAVTGTRFKAHFTVKPGSEDQTQSAGGNMDFTFKTEQDRADFLSVVLCCLSFSTIFELCENAANAGLGTFSTVQDK